MAEFWIIHAGRGGPAITACSSLDLGQEIHIPIEKLCLLHLLQVATEARLRPDIVHGGGPTVSLVHGKNYVVTDCSLL